MECVSPASGRQARSFSGIYYYRSLALLAKVREIDAQRLLQALHKTFDFRNTHPLPKTVPMPPTSWSDVYQRISEEDDLDWKNLSVLTDAVGAFLNPILDGLNDLGSWHPKAWAWMNR